MEKKCLLSVQLALSPLLKACKININILGYITVTFQTNVLLLRTSLSRYWMGLKGQDRQKIMLTSCMPCSLYRPPKQEAALISPWIIGSYPPFSHKSQITFSLLVFQVMTSSGFTQFTDECLACFILNSFHGVAPHSRRVRSTQRKYMKREGENEDQCLRGFTQWFFNHTKKFGHISV